MQLLGTLLECFITGLFAAICLIMIDMFIIPEETEDKE